MGDEDSSGRFDYLFEPIAGETTTTELPAVDAVDDVVAERTRTRRWWPLLTVATVAAVAIVAGLILWWPDPVDAVRSPAATTTEPSPAPVVTSATLVEAPPESPPPPDPSPELTTPPVPGPAPAPQPPLPTPQPVPSPSNKSDGGQPPASIERSPMSVSPEPRPAFPEQHPPGNNKGSGGGGLLGRLGL